MRPAVVTVVLLASVAPLEGQALGTALLPTGTIRPCMPSQGAHRAFVQGDRLEAAYQLLLDRSPTFAGAIAAVESSGMLRVRIGYRHHVMRPYERLMGEDRSAAAFLSDDPLRYPTGNIQCHVRVVFFTDMLEEDLLRAGVPEDVVVLDLALVLAHEVFGHLVPFAEQGVTLWPSPCRDPDRRTARRTTGCAVDRENLVRRELGVPTRPTYAHVDGPLLCALPGQRCVRWKLSTIREGRAGVRAREIAGRGPFGLWRIPDASLDPTRPVRTIRVRDDVVDPPRATP